MPAERVENGNSGGIAAGTREGVTANAHAAGLEYLQHFFQLGDRLADPLLVVPVIRLRPLNSQTLAAAADGEYMIVKQRADLADHQHILTLIVAPIAAPLDRGQLGKLLIPVAQHVGFHRAELDELT